MVETTGKQASWINEAIGRVSIELNRPPPTQIDIGRMSDVALDEDVCGGVGAEDVVDATADAETVQAILQGEGGGGLGCACHDNGGSERDARACCEWQAMENSAPEASKPAKTCLKWMQRR